MKVTKTTTTERETSSSIDLFSDLKLSTKQKAEIRDQVGSYLFEQTLSYVADSSSPIAGETWKGSLEKQYAKLKDDKVGNTDADLQLTGRMLDQLKVEDEPDGIKIGVFGERAPVADGHCDLSGKSELTRRRFLPDVGQSYQSPIEKEVARIIADIVGEGSFTGKSLETFKTVENSRELFSSLREYFGDGSLTRTELRLAVYRNKRLLNLLDEEDLLELL